MKKHYQNPQTEAVRLTMGDTMQGALIGTSPSPGAIEAPERAVPATILRY